MSAAAGKAVASMQQVAQRAADAVSDYSSEEPQQRADSQKANGASNRSHGASQGSSARSPSQGSSVTSPAPERAKHALLQRIAMVTDSYSGEDCSCFDTTLGCLLKVSLCLPCSACLNPAMPLHADVGGALLDACCNALTIYIYIYRLSKQSQHHYVSTTQCCAE